jgi:hypothetical protein
VTTSFIRLVAVQTHSAADVEASAPDIIMRRVSRPRKDHDPSDDTKPIALRLMVMLKD